MPSRQLLVDISVIHSGDAHTGIQRVVRSLLLQLLNSPPCGYVICPVFATRSKQYRHTSRDFFLAHLLKESISSSAASKVTRDTDSIQVLDGDIFLGLDLAAHILPVHRRQLLGWKRAGLKVHMLVYDLLPLQHPEWFNARTSWNFRRWIKCVAIYADSAVCISNTVKADLGAFLLRQFKLPHNSVVVSTIVLGAHIGASVPTKGLAAEAKLILTRLRAVPGVLMVGTLEPRKGYDQALAAFELHRQVASSAAVLVIVGRPGWKTANLQRQIRSHPQLNTQIFWFDDASDELLQELYAVCRGVLVASHGEGFGLPLVEAALQSKPILARDIPVFRELCLPNISFFNGSTPKALAQAISEWLADTASEPSSVPIRGTAQAVSELYLWKTAASDLLRNLGLQCTAQ